MTSWRGAQGICRAGDEGISWTGAGGGCSGDPISMSASSTPVSRVYCTSEWLLVFYTAADFSAHECTERAHRPALSWSMAGRNRCRPDALVGQGSSGPISQGSCPGATGGGDSEYARSA